MKDALKAGITFVFGQAYLPTRRHRKARIRHMVTCRDISFKKVDINDFPVAFIVQDYFTVYEGNTWDEYMENRNSDNGNYRMMDIEIRTYEGKLYKARRFNYGSAIGTSFCPIDDAINGVRYIGKNMSWYDHGVYAYKSADATFDAGKSVIISDNLDERVAELQRQADRYIFSDGKIWEECGEPMYVVNTFGLGHNHGGTGMFIESFYNSNISAKNYFNALEREEAIAYANMVAAGRGDTNDVGKFGEHENIVVLMPEMVKHDPNVEHVNGGDPFMESLETIINGSDSIAEAGIGVIAMTMAQLATA